jgi:hypothetical protein
MAEELEAMKPDGRVTIKFTDDVTVEYPFAEMRYHSRHPSGYVIAFGYGQMFYPWHTIKYVHVTYNSPQYVAWANENEQQLEWERSGSG